MQGTLERERRMSKAARVVVVLLVAWWQGWGAAAIAAENGSSSEYAVKAAFLYHFAQFVEWPEGAFRDANSPLVYCTIGFDPFEGALDATLKGKSVNGRAIEVRHLKQAPEAQGCHLLFVGEGQKRQIPAVLAQFHGTPVLLVGESEKFATEGGTIGFVLEENKVRFEVNLEAAEKSRLKISAKLLALAKTVIGTPKRG